MIARLLIFIFLIGGPLCMYQGWRAEQELTRQKAQGKRVPGKVVNRHQERPSRKWCRHFVDVVFTPEGGSETQQSFEVSEAFYQSLGEGPQITRLEVSIRYVPGESQSAALVDGSVNESGMFLNGIIATLAGLAGCAWMAWQRVRRVA